MKILIVDDDRDIRETLRIVIEMNGHKVQLAADGETAVRLAAERPDVILCDIGLPGMDGYAVLQAIRALPEGREVPFIFLTARAERQDLRRGMALGADDYLTKPFTEQDVLDAIAARVRRQEPLRHRVQALLAERQTVAMADWSHELMTPLNGVLGGLELIESEAESIKPAELRELLGLIRSGAERQFALSRKLVAYFGFERQRNAWEPQVDRTCGAAETIRTAAKQAAQMEERGGDLDVACGSAQIALHAQQFGPAVAELVQNSARYSPPGTRITVRGDVRGRRYVCTVQDAGPGLTEKERELAGPFVRFKRGNRERSGLGLGLAIARSVAAIGRGSLTMAPAEGGAGWVVRLEVELAAG